MSDDLNPRTDYGRSFFDNRHAVALSLNVNPWRGLGAGAVFRYYSGYPINEFVGSDVNRDRDTFDRPVRGVDDDSQQIVSPVDSTGRAVRNGMDGESLRCSTSVSSTCSICRARQPWTVLGDLQTPPTG